MKHCLKHIAFAYLAISKRQRSTPIDSKMFGIYGRKLKSLESELSEACDSIRNSKIAA